MRQGSVNNWLAELQAGEYRYIEVDISGYDQMMRKLNPAKTKRPPELRNRAFTTSLHTAIGSANPRDIRYLVRVERTQ